MSKYYLKNFVPIGYNETWERINYYGLQSLIVIYLTTIFHKDYAHAYQVYGVFAALIFGFGIIGGVIADRLLGAFNAILLGAICLLLANVILLTETLQSVYVGASLIIIGVGLLKPPNTILLSKVFEGEVLKRSYSFFYIAGNLGSIIGPIVYGLDVTTHDFKLGFAFSVIGNFSLIISILFLLPARKLEKHKVTISKLLMALGIVVVSLSIIYLLASQIIKLKYVMVPLFVALLLYLAKIYRNIPIEERSKFVSLSMPTIISIIFYSLLLQLYAPIVVWLKNNVNETVFGWHIPPTWFGTIEAVFVMVAPIFLSRFWKLMHRFKFYDNCNNRMTVGLLFTSITFMLFSGSALLGSSALIILGVVIASFLLSLGEISVFPTALEEVGNKSPAQYKSTIMGIFYFCMVFSGYLSGVIASSSPTDVHSPQAYSEFFLVVGVVTLVLAVVLHRVGRVFK